MEIINIKEVIMKKILKVKDYLLEVLNGVEGIPSFELARMVGKRHDHVLVAIVCDFSFSSFILSKNFSC